MKLPKLKYFTRRRKIIIIIKYKILVYNNIIINIIILQKYEKNLFKISACKYEKINLTNRSLTLYRNYMGNSVKRSTIVVVVFNIYIYIYFAKILYTRIIVR